VSWVTLTADRDEDLVQKPGVAETPLAACQATRVLRSELDRPLSDRFVCHVHATLREPVLDLPEAQTKSEIQSNRLADDPWRKAMPDVAGSASFHPVSLHSEDLS